MRILAVWATALFLATSAGVQAAAPADGLGSARGPGESLPDAAGKVGTRETAPDAPPLTRSQQLDRLFQTLSTAKDDEAASAAEDGIAAIWLKSGSDTVDLLMEWTQAAVKDKNYPLALDYLDRILTLKPDYAEGWNTRATVYYMTEEYGHALADIERTLALEPRHFGALTGLGAILTEIGDDRRALAVYRRAIELDPHLPNVQQAIDELTAKGTDGQGI